MELFRTHIGDLTPGIFKNLAQFNLIYDASIG